MALEDNVAFFHAFDAETPDYPTSGWAAVTNPGSLTDPTYNGLAVCDGTEGASFDRSDAGDVLNVSANGAFGIAFRVEVTSGGSSSEVLFEFGGGFDAMGAYMRGTTQLCLWLFTPTSTQIRLNTGSITVGTAATFAFTRAASSSDWVVYKDGSEITPLTEAIGNSAMIGNTFTLAARDNGTAAIAQEMDWICTWERQLTTSELANNMNETDIKTALGLGGGGGPPAGGMNLLGVGA